MINKKFFQHLTTKIVLSFITGLIGILSFSPYNYWITIYLSFSGLLFLTLNCTVYQASLIGYFWGIGFFGSGINWIYISIYNFSNMPKILGIVIMILLINYLSFYPLLFSFLQSYLFPVTSFIRLVIISPLFWYFIEILRGYCFTGFPWIQFGYSQIDGPCKGLAPLFGVEFITFIITIISGLLVYSINKKNLLSLIFILVLVAVIIPIKYITWYKLESNNNTNISLVQGNIAQSIKWDSTLQNSILNNYLKLSQPFIYNNSIIIWPESAITGIEYNNQIFLKKIDNYLKNHSSILISGIIDKRIKEKKHYFYNTIIVLGSKTKYDYYHSQRYRKNHLVPFGEFVPFETLLKSINELFNLPMSSFNQGNYIQPQLKFLNYKTTATICYEIILGKQLRDNFKISSNFILNISNDAWFGKSIGPWQHFQMARMRALELGRPLLRSTNNGITAVIKADGNIQKIIPQFKNTVLSVKVIPTFGTTPYAKFGNTLLSTIIFLFFQIAIFKIIKNLFK